MPAPDDERLDSFETCRANQKNCEIKIVYKNCASRWLLTHCNMMHGTYNVKLARLKFLVVYSALQGKVNDRITLK